jgi:replication-associated recombination protein RarA
MIKLEQHFDIISALIKSIRGSDPNAAVCWLARMIEDGEDVKFVQKITNFLQLKTWKCKPNSFGYC